VWPFRNYTFYEGEKVKILMLSPQPFFEPRGTPISIYQRLEALTSLGHEVDLVTFHVGKDVTFPNLKIHRVRKVGAIQHVRIGPSKAKILLDVLVFLKAFELLLKKKYDVIHSHEESSFFAMFLAWVFRTRHLYDMHSLLSKQMGNFSFGNKPLFIKIFQILEKMVLSTCDAVITVGSDLEKYVRSVKPSINVEMIENIALQVYQTSVQPEQIEHLQRSLNLEGRLPIVYAGTYEQYQGLDLLRDCAPLVAKEFPNVVFIFVGAKNQQAREWTEKAQELGLSEHLRYLDVVSPEESMIYLAYASILASPRLNGTTTPLKIYSYLHAQKPIIATNILAHTQVLSPEMAVLVEPTKEALAEGIIKILRDPELANRLGKNASEYAKEKFSHKDYLSKVNLIYQFRRPGLDLNQPVLSERK
jgi:glycosyltransferase involved in cell wall biosynthesis